MLNFQKRAKRIAESYTARDLVKEIFAKDADVR